MSHFVRVKARLIHDRSCFVCASLPQEFIWYLTGRDAQSLDGRKLQNVFFSHPTRPVPYVATVPPRLWHRARRRKYLRFHIATGPALPPGA